MLDDLKVADEEELLILEEEFREWTMKEAETLLHLDEIRAAKQRVRRLVAEKKNRYAPIFTLPDELLVAIVQVAQESPDAGELVEVTVSHVSQRFRWAVLGASALWSSIELRWGAESDEERFAVYIARSRTCTLAVKLSYGAYHGKEDRIYEEVRSELATVAQHIARIRHLVLHYGGLGLSRRDTLIHFEWLYAPCLEYLELSNASEMGAEWEPSVSILCAGAPRLTTVKLNNVFLTLTFGLANPWVSRLTRLDFRGMASRQGINPELLTHCPQLMDVTLDNTTFFFDLESIPIPISMPSLQSFRALCLDDQSHTALIGILSHIIAPALEVLQFSGRDIDISQIMSFFNLLSPAQFPILKSLTFANSSVNEEECTCPRRDWGDLRPETLRRFSALESLTMVNICHVNSLLEYVLTMWTDAAGVHSSLPSLHTLTLRYKDSDCFGIAGWPKLPSASASLEPNDAALDELRVLLAPLRELRPLHLRLPRSRFFTERDWNPADPNFEIFDVDPLLRSLGYTEAHEDGEA
ncbi:hypothetical protein K438DRAFT_1930599 [Mycena galopus ATCC 62051]|nr:hypothetical protein K438DRAFT_1930599 [Mycena galopus ATCC 62051]